MMTDQTPSYNLAPLRNVTALAMLVERLKNRSYSLPGMGVFFGPSGYGKTVASIYSTNHHRAITVQVKSVWTKKTLCEAILREIGLKAEPTISDMLDQISQHLATTDGVLIIDEADFLVQRKMIEIVRDIYEGSGAAIVLIGEEALPQKLRPWERVHGRILDWVRAEPGDMTDVTHLTKIYAPGISVDRDLQKKLLAASHGSIRRICVNLDRVREFALLKGLSAVSVNDWGQGQFFSGVAPDPRRGSEAVGRAA